jgi:hypothetical protein
MASRIAVRKSTMPLALTSMLPPSGPVVALPFSPANSTAVYVPLSWKTNRSWTTSSAPIKPKSVSELSRMSPKDSSISKLSPLAPAEPVIPVSQR